jgi:hypothetical protein
MSEISIRQAGDIICNQDTYLIVDIGGAQMTCPRASLEWQMRYGSPEKHRFVAASALDSYEYLVVHCNKEEAWRRIKLMRKAMKDNPPKGEYRQVEDSLCKLSGSVSVGGARND